MQRLLLVLTACLFALLVSAARACPVMTPDREALVDVEVSSIRLPLEVGVALVADGEAAVAGEPGDGAFDLPAVSAEAVAGVDAAAGDARDDAALA